MVVWLATGAADALTGRFIDVTADDPDELLRHADEIEQRGLYRLTLQRLPPA